MKPQLRAPWEFSEAPAPGEGTPNLPTPAGRLLGRQLARLCDLEEAKDLEGFPDQLPRCDDCAFRLGTRPNGCAETLMDAVKCIIEIKPFYCHKGVKEGEAPKHLCRGWLTLSGKVGRRAMTEIVEGAARGRGP